ncbi:MAG TPA: malto-oligosyltrehalose trehalohydrolase, partial [Pirellulales bacterium]|nr:malto-oligosyltrehalose trehalohydrolase [Pirellulales bacterium]
MSDSVGGISRRLPVGAEVQPGGGVHFRVWAPRRRQLQVVFGPEEGGGSEIAPLQLAAEGNGYFSGLSAAATIGTRYRFRLDDEPLLYPDPASRLQPEGVHGRSEVVDPGRYRWRDADWQGVSIAGQVIYELHIGTFTPEGTWAAAAEKLHRLVEIGITVIEVMPVAEFHGRFGWGYDGVDLFAPTHLYGTPDAFRAFVDHAHSLGLGVILDVVYNHFGPIGCYVAAFSNDYFSTKHHTPWGQAINFDGDNCAAVREFFVGNAGYWIDEFHVDGLRLDAVQAIEDDSPDHILAAITRRVREAARGRSTIVVAENEYQQAWLAEPVESGGYGLDGMWNDDFHHTARVAMTGHNEYYYNDYHGTPQEMISAVTRGFLYQGQWNVRQQKHRGSPAGRLHGMNFVNFLQNHDQVANSASGLPAHFLTSPGRARAMTAVLLLAPGTPLLFQGQEFAASAPFLFFADFEVEMAELVRTGRQEGLREFRSLTGPDSKTMLADPCDIATFDRCKLDWSQRDRHEHAIALHTDLLRLRRDDTVFASQRADRIAGAVLSSEAYLLRYFGDDGDDRLLLVNMGRDLSFRPPAAPLLAAPRGRTWQLLWSSENPRY